MAKEDVVIALGQPENAAIESSIGPILRPLLDKEGWEEIILLQHLDQASPRLEGWNGLFNRARNAMADPNVLGMKGANSLGKVGISRFNDALDDFVAEMLAAIYLAETGHTGIRFVPEGEALTVDLESQCDGVRYFTEVKNLREPRSLSFVAFRRWHMDRTIRPDEFMFSAEFLDLEDPLTDLTADQEAGVNALVDDLPCRKVPSEFDQMLPGGRRIRIRLSEGSPVMIRHGSGPFVVGPIVERAMRFLLLKLMEPARKALSQLYRPEFPEDARRLLFLRWKLPEEIAAIGESETVRSAVHQRTENFLRLFFPNFALTIIHTLEDPKNAPKAVWE